MPCHSLQCHVYPVPSSGTQCEIYIYTQSYCFFMLEWYRHVCTLIVKGHRLSGGGKLQVPLSPPQKPQKS